MDTIRAKQIMQSSDSIQVLHQGSPVWINKIMENNTAEIIYSNNKKEIVPVYMLVEDNPVK